MLYKISSDLSRVYTAQKQVQQAARLLNRFVTADLPMRTLAQRLIWTAQAELLLALERPATALELLDQLIASAANRTETTVIPRLWVLRGRALAALQRVDEAQATLQAASTAAQAWDNWLDARRIQAELGKLYLKQGRRMEAQEAFARARAVVERLAAALPAGELQEHFYAQATRELPHGALVSPQKATQRLFNGLTQREREVAALVAHGKSNRAIAETLTLSERTIEKHIENIMAKLDFSSRSQIAVWAAEKKLSDAS
jgi:DNA-binding NarL/FixJ family response regulator